jgi:outer membrane protein TolC
MRRLPLLLLFAASPALAEPLTLQGAIDLALGKNPDVAVAKEAVAGNEAKTSSTKAKRWVALGLNATFNQWRDPYALDFGGQSFVLHEIRTTATVVTLVQPLTGLGYLTQLIDASEHETEASRHEYDRVRLDTAYRTAEAYIHVLEARASADVAHRSVDDIASGLTRAQQLRQADTYTDIDVLRFRSAKAAADQSALKADNAILSALATLTIQLGLPDGTAIDLADSLPPTPPPLAVTLEQAQQRAIAARPELGAARERVAAADNMRKGAYKGYVPDIRAVAAWQHLTGVQPFQPENEEYIGLSASWTVWDWGSTHQSILEAEHTKARAILGAGALAEQVKLDVRKRWLDAKTQFDSLAAAQVQQQTADEAFRLQKVKFDASAATTTDVLDAETDAKRANLGFAVARYEYYLALVALARSMGDLPKP